jgi:hypothetical protein
MIRALLLLKASLLVECSFIARRGHRHIIFCLQQGKVVYVYYLFLCLLHENELFSSYIISRCVASCHNVCCTYQALPTFDFTLIFPSIALVFVRPRLAHAEV